MTMSDKQQLKTIHEHRTEPVHVLMQRAGVPYEVEQKVCADCARVLAETTVRRAAA
jgi:NMD protein affecting ribosome stability and mRNA decay